MTFQGREKLQLVLELRAEGGELIFVAVGGTQHVAHEYWRILHRAGWHDLLALNY